MLFGFDERGQAIQIGAVLLFGLLIISFSTYQAFVVPDQNKQVEFKHSQTVQQDLQEVRNAVVSASGARAESVTVSLGTQYPSRALFVNPSPPTGSLRTAGTTNASLNLTIRNATGGGEIGDFWNGTTRRYATGALVYQPNYNEFRGAPTVVYEHSVLYNQYRNQNVTLTGQRLVDDTDLTLLTLNGSLGETRSGSFSMEVDPVSVSERRIEVGNDSNNVTVSFPSRLGAGKWRKLIDGEFTDQGGHVEGLRSEPLGSGVQLIHVDLEPGVDYDLRMKKVGVGTGIVETSPEYLLPVEGNGTTIPEGATTRLVVEVRDGYNNPVSGRTVNASASLPGGSVSPTQRATNVDGRLVLEYDAPENVNGVTQQRDRINVSFTVGSPNLNDSSFDRSEPASATIPVRVTNADSSGLGGGTGGGGAYDVNWANPDSQNGVSCSPDEDGTCTIDGSVTPTVDLTLLTPTDGASTQYAVSDRSVGTVSPESGTTNTNGEDSTTFTLKNNGSVKVYGSSGGGGDVLDVEVANFKASGIGETGRVSFAAGTNQKTVTLRQSYRNPVIIAKPVDDSSTEPRYVRVVGNTSDSITLEVDKFGDTANPATTVHYLVLETGVHELDDGTTVEAGSNMVDGSYDQVSYKSSYSGVTPVVFSQTQTTNDETPVVVRQRNVGANSFEHKLQESEAAGQTGHGTERVGYVAIQRQQGTTGGVAYEVGERGNVEGYEQGFYGISFSQTYSSTPTFFAQMQTEDGPNTAWERYRGLTTTGVEVTIDEETTADGEQSHTTEDVGYFVFGELGTIAGTTISSPGGGGGRGGDTTNPTVDSFSVTDNSVAPPTKEARFTVDWTVSDETQLSDVTITLTRTSSGTEVDSVSPSVSGKSASGSSTVEDTNPPENPKNVEYTITLTVTDAAGNSASQSDTQNGDGNNGT